MEINNFLSQQCSLSFQAEPYCKVRLEKNKEVKNINVREKEEVFILPLKVAM